MFIIYLIFMEDVDFIEYDRKLIECAKNHRKEKTRAESLFWSIVRNRKIWWYKFRREKVIGEFILDFYCSELLLWVEIDGWYHNETWDYDEERSNRLYDKYGIAVVRFTNDEVEKNLNWVRQYMEEIVKNRERELSNLTPTLS